MTPWISLFISAGSSLLLIGAAYGSLLARSKQNTHLVKELADHTKEQIQEIKQTKASTERMDAIADRIDRMEESVNQKLEEIKESIKELSRLSD